MTQGSAVERVLIIGSGPAGWTAAIYAARANLSPLCVIGVPRSDPAPVLPGGQLMLTTEVENYPGFPQGVTGPELMDHFQRQAQRFGTRICEDDVVSCDFQSRPLAVKLASGKTLHAHSVIIATGATANWVGVPNELRLAQSGGGVSACAVCDGALPVYRGKELAVVGGGDTAMEEATYLTKFASKVHVIHRRDSFRASRVMQDRLFSAPNAVAVWNKRLVNVVGAERIEAVELEDTVSGARSTLAVAGLFVAIGHSPATGFLQGSGITLDNHGYVALATRSSATNIDGVFAAGDVADSQYRQAVTAAGMGCQAALECERWLGARGIH
ncbi:MAG: thioredoxin-disulfide reductase [Phycisphaerales bacterium]|nr:thioredoxin-disulfide reductase [Phycisphaerales bacterium]